MKRFDDSHIISFEKQKLFIEMLLYIEEIVGFKAVYKFFYSSYFEVNNFEDLQLITKKMAEFIGLSHIAFVVNIGETNDNNAGNIELNFDDVTFIELNQSITNNKMAVFSTLSHEISHKYIQLNNLNTKYTGIELEYLTDITAIYLGFGKHMLEGCEIVTNRKKYSHEENSIFEEDIKSKYGYLTSDELAFMFILICKIRNITENEYLKDLSNDVKSLLYRNKDYDILSIDTSTKSINNHSLYTLDSLIFEFDKRIDDIKTIIDSLQSEINFLSETNKSLDNRETYNICLKKLLVIKNEMIIKNSGYKNKQFHQYLSKLDKLITSFKKLLKLK